MIPVSVSLTGFLLTLIIHFAWWRIRLPDNTLGTLFRLSLAGLVAVTAVTGVLTGGSLSATLYALCLFGAAALCYLITYTAIDSDSPTLTLVAAMASRDGRGMTAAEIEDFVDSRPFVRSRVDQMARDGLLQLHRDGTYELTGTSLTALRLFDAYRRVVNRRSKGG